MFRILLVDDEAQERDGIRFLIEKYRLPLSVVEAQNGQKALEYLKGHPVDILSTDVKMPYKDGRSWRRRRFSLIRISGLLSSARMGNLSMRRGRWRPTPWIIC